MLDAGQIDTIAHIISTTEERRKKYDLSDTYAYSTYQFTVEDDSFNAGNGVMLSVGNGDNNCFNHSNPG